MAKNPVNVPNTASSMENTSNIHRIICLSYVDISVNKNANSFKVSLLCISQSRVKFLPILQNLSLLNAK